MTGLLELLTKGLLAKYVVASLFRVTWGYSLAVALARRLERLRTVRWGFQEESA